MEKKLNYFYLVIQGILMLISLVFLWGILDALIQQVGGWIFVDALLLIIELAVGITYGVKNLKEPSDKNLRIMTYIPFLLFIEGGIIATLGFILMGTAMYLRFKHVEPQKV